MIHIKCQVLFSQKNKTKIKLSSAAEVISTLRVKNFPYLTSCVYDFGNKSPSDRNIIYPTYAFGMGAFTDWRKSVTERNKYVKQ